MKLVTTAIAGPMIVELEFRADSRGHFARTYDRLIFENAGLDANVEQCNLSFNHKAGTVRGMHYQQAPAPEAKLVRCTRGAIIDIIVDMRPGSPTQLQHIAVELTADGGRALYVPPYFAHGYQTLEHGTEVSYQVSGAYAPEHERGLRPDDPSLRLPWPLPISVISEKDASWPLLADRPGMTEATG